MMCMIAPYIKTQVNQPLIDMLGSKLVHCASGYLVGIVLLESNALH